MKAPAETASSISTHKATVVTNPSMAVADPAQRTSVLTKPTLSISVEYERPAEYYALTRAEHREIERSLVVQVKRHFRQSLLDAWAVLDPTQVKVGSTVFAIADESMSIANVRAYVDAQLMNAGDTTNTFRTLSSAESTSSRACHWIDLFHKYGFTFCLEKNRSGQPYKLTGTASTGSCAVAFIKIKFEFEEPAKSGA